MNRQVECSDDGKDDSNVLPHVDDSVVIRIHNERDDTYVSNSLTKDIQSNKYIHNISNHTDDIQNTYIKISDTHYENTYDDTLCDILSHTKITNNMSTSKKPTKIKEKVVERVRTIDKSKVVERINTIDELKVRMASYTDEIINDIEQVLEIDNTYINSTGLGNNELQYIWNMNKWN
jgi:hypothetical protein